MLNSNNLEKYKLKLIGLTVGGQIRGGEPPKDFDLNEPNQVMEYSTYLLNQVTNYVRISNLEEAIQSNNELKQLLVDFRAIYDAIMLEKYEKEKSGVASAELNADARVAAPSADAAANAGAEAADADADAFKAKFNTIIEKLQIIVKQTQDPKEYTQQIIHRLGIIKTDIENEQTDINNLFNVFASYYKSDVEPVYTINENLKKQIQFFIDSNMITIHATTDVDNITNQLTSTGAATSGAATSVATLVQKFENNNNNRKGGAKIDELSSEQIIQQSNELLQKVNVELSKGDISTAQKFSDEIKQLLEEVTAKYGKHEEHDIINAQTRENTELKMAEANQDKANEDSIKAADKAPEANKAPEADKAPEANKALAEQAEKEKIARDQETARDQEAASKMKEEEDKRVQDKLDKMNTIVACIDKKNKEIITYFKPNVELSKLIKSYTDDKEHDITKKYLALHVIFNNIMKEISSQQQKYYVMNDCFKDTIFETEFDEMNKKSLSRVERIIGTKKKGGNREKSNSKTRKRQKSKKHRRKRNRNKSQKNN